MLCKYNATYTKENLIIYLQGTYSSNSVVMYFQKTKSSIKYLIKLKLNVNK